MNPLVSVIMPAHQAEQTLAQSVHSVLAQSFADWELELVVDCKSTDGTLAIATELAGRDKRLRVIRNLPEGGCAYNRNAAMAQARGRHLAFLDSDDLWHPLKLERQLAAIHHREAALSCTGYGWMNSNGHLLDTVILPPREVTREKLLWRNSMGCLTVMLDRQRFAQPRFINELHEDYILWLELTRNSPALGLGENLATYRLSPSSRSGNKRRAAIQHWRILRHHAGLSLATSLLRFAGYCISSLVPRLR